MNKLTVVRRWAKRPDPKLVTGPLSNYSSMLRKTCSMAVSRYHFYSIDLRNWKFRNKHGSEQGISGSKWAIKDL